jgi:D-sedoheptulose 7-phosphate isomerase
MAELFTPAHVRSAIEESIATKQQLVEQCSEAIHACGTILAQAAAHNHLIMLCGNGGSAADAQHIAAELVVRFRSTVNRRAIAALALTVDSSVLTAGGNDYGFENVFARQVEAFGKPGSILIAISTSGTSPNVVKAVEKAKSTGVTVIGLLGGSGGTLKDLCDASVTVPSSITARIQESHILIGHIWCEMIESQIGQP